MQPGVRPVTHNQWQFTLWAPRASQVELELEGAAAPVPLTQAGGGWWTTTITVPGAETTYRYRLNGDLRRPDPASAFQPDGVHGPSQIVDHAAFDWTDAAFEPPPLADYILYEIHIGTFTPEGTFDAAAERLATLAELGITAVEVMPVAQFPGGRNWGYDGTFPYAVQNSYGGPDAFKRFIDTAHRLGLAVILDVVYNHLGPEGNYLRDFGPYFTDHYTTPWGEAINFDQADSDPVRAYFIENALFWYRHYHIDVLRLDALHAIVDRSARHFIQELTERVQTLAGELNRPLFVIGESDLNDVRLIRPVAAGGYGLDAQWSDDFHHSLHALLTGERFGYYQDFGAVADLAKALREGFVYDGRYSAFRRRTHGSSSADRPGRQFVVCAQNHDQIGNRMRGERLSRLVDFESLKLAAGCVMLAPSLPLLFMGDDYGAPQPFLYFISMTDADLVEAIRRGRAAEFEGFPRDGDGPDPQAPETFEQSILDWSQRDSGRAAVLVAFYRRLIQLRRSVPSFTARDFRAIDVLDAPRILYWHRQWGRRQWLCLMNSSDRTQRFACPAAIAAAANILDSAAACWQGPGTAAPAVLTGGDRVTMPPHSLCLYETEGPDR